MDTETLGKIRGQMNFYKDVTLTDEGEIETKNGKTGIFVFVKGNRLYVRGENNRKGRLIFSGAFPHSIQDFLEGFWYMKKSPAF